MVVPPGGKMKKRQVELRVSGDAVYLEVFKDDKAIDNVPLDSVPEPVEGIPTMFRAITSEGSAFFQLESAAACREFLETVEEEVCFACTLARHMQKIPLYMCACTAFIYGDIHTIQGWSGDVC